MTDDAVNAAFLSTLRAGSGARKLAWTVLLASALVFLAAAPYAKTPLARVDAFLPIYQSALVICELITATLLFGQFTILHSRALLLLASAYLFSALMAVAHALSFPGLFAPIGLLGGGAQTTAWIYYLWHGGFPLLVCLYVYWADSKRTFVRWPVRIAVVLSILFVVLLVVMLVLLCTKGHDQLPVIMQGNQDATTKIIAAASTWLLSLAALSMVLLWRRPLSILDLWLVVVLFIWIFDTALASVLNGGRFDLGWYAGRIYGLLAATFVLLVLLLEHGRLYRRLALSHAGEQQKSADLEQLGLQLEAANIKLAAQNRQLQEVSRLKSEFLANMSHELRTPLNAIIGFSEVLKDGVVGELDADQQEFICDIFNSGQHLLSLINDILDLSKVEAGKMTLDLEMLEMDSLLRGSLSIIKEKAANQRIQVQLDLPEALGQIRIDARKTKQILYNLLSNAVKFTPEGGQICLRATRVLRAAIENWRAEAPTAVLQPLQNKTFSEFLQLSVSDSGRGISSKEAPKLFQAFSQIDASLARETEGTGLGLVLILKLAQLLGGTVALASTPGQGSTFTVWLPWRELETPADDKEQLPALDAMLSTAPVILVIEDDDRAATLLRVQLASYDLSIVRASCAAEAMAWLATTLPAAIVLDILLPDINGWDLLAQLKASGAPTTSVPIVVVSIAAEKSRGHALGAAAVLQKPVGRQELLDALAVADMQHPDRPLAHVFSSAP